MRLALLQAANFVNIECDLQETLLSHDLPRVLPQMLYDVDIECDLN